MLAYVFALLGAVGVDSETSGFDSKPRASLIQKAFSFFRFVLIAKGSHALNLV